MASKKRHAEVKKPLGWLDAPRWWPTPEKSESMRPVWPVILIGVYVAVVWLMALTTDLFGEPPTKFLIEDYERNTLLYCWVSAAAATFVGQLAILGFALYFVAQSISDGIFPRRYANGGFIAGLLLVLCGEWAVMSGNAGGMAAGHTMQLLYGRFIAIVEWIDILNRLTIPTVVMAVAVGIAFHRYDGIKGRTVAPVIARRVQTFFILSCWFLVAGVFEIYFSNAFADTQNRMPGLCLHEDLLRLVRDTEPDVCHPIRAWGKSLSGLASVGFSLIILLVFGPLIAHVNRTLIPAWRESKTSDTFEDWLQTKGLFTRPITLAATAFGILAPIFSGLVAKLI